MDAISLLLGALLVLLLVSAILLVPLLASFRVYNKWRKMAERDYERLRLKDVDNDRLLIIRTVGDEATAAIAAARFVGWAASTVYEGLFGAVRLALVPILWVVDVMNKRAAELNPFLLVWLVALGLICYLILFAASLLVVLPVLLVMIMTAVSGIGYGRTSMFLEFSAESSPSGSHAVHLYEADVDGSSLAHCESYRHGPAIESAVRWISELEAPQSQ